MVCLGDKITLDQWTLNDDRHDENVAYFPGTGVAAFDFDSALIGLKPPESIRENLRLGVDRPVSRHPLAAQLLDVSYLASWQTRVALVPRRDIESIVYKCVDAGLLNEPDSGALTSLYPGTTGKAGRIFGECAR